jgi:serine/threonine protein kinase/tetratricopeptide (TPR) repeat protein
VHSEAIVIGRQLSHYRILEAIGSGGMGTVYRAEDTLLGRPVALKFPHLDVTGEPTLRARFVREARAASVLDHPNIVVIYDICEIEGEIFIAMQCVEGQPLRERLKTGPLPGAVVTATGREVADALAHAHARGVIHRDIKPENILVTDDGRVKVADFGLASIASDLALTHTHEFAGTPSFTAPEVIQSRPVDARADLYSLGVVLYEMCAGQPPFHGDHAAVLYRTVHEAPPPLPAGVPTALANLIGALLDKEPERRPADAAAVADALGRLTGGGTPTPDLGSRSLRSIAILPFENMTGNPEENYFCSGMTEEVLTDVLRIHDLQVASRTTVEALRARGWDARQIGHELGVDTVMEGGVRRSGDRIRVTTRLVNTDTGFPIWAERYDRHLADVFEVQEDISRHIAGALQLVFKTDVADIRLGRRTRSPRAHDLRLKAAALHAVTEEAEMRQAIALLDEAVREDPTYALAWADLGECCVQMVCKSWDRSPSWLDRANQHTLRALELAPQLPDAYRARGHLFMHQRRPDLALRDFTFSAELDPRFAPAQNNLAMTYMLMGDMGRGEIYARRAHALDPQRPSPLLNLSEVLLRTGRLNESRVAARQALALTSSLLPRLNALDLLLSAAYQEQDRTALPAILAELREHEASPIARALLAFAAAFAGQPDEARRRLSDAAVIGCSHILGHVNAARAWALLGDHAAAVEALERALDLEIVALAEVHGDSLLEPLFADPRFRDVKALLSATA